MTGAVVETVSFHIPQHVLLKLWRGKIERHSIWHGETIRGDDMSIKKQIEISVVVLSSHMQNIFIM